MCLNLFSHSALKPFSCVFNLHNSSYKRTFTVQLFCFKVKSSPHTHTQLQVERSILLVIAFFWYCAQRGRNDSQTHTLLEWRRKLHILSPEQRNEGKRGGKLLELVCASHDVAATHVTGATFTFPTARPSLRVCAPKHLCNTASWRQHSYSTPS